MKRYDVMYCEGPGNIAGAFTAWRNSVQLSSETSKTFSSELFDFCREHEVTLYATSTCEQRAPTAKDETFTVRNMPHSSLGRGLAKVPKIGYHLSLLSYTVRLLLLSWWIRPRVIIVTSGVTGWEFFPLLNLSRAKLVPCLHNALWTPGSPEPRNLRARLTHPIYRFVWRRVAWRTLAVSAAVRRQIVALAPEAQVTIFWPRFSAKEFLENPEAADWKTRPFRVLYAGRIEENKGALDLVEIATALRANGAHCIFDVCGTGSALPELKRRIAAQELDGYFDVHGKLERPRLVAQYKAAHCMIVPTRTSFCEGFTMAALEALLLGRPVVTSQIVPPSESFGNAMLLASPDLPISYATELQLLMQQEQLYKKLTAAALASRPLILDHDLGLREGLKTVVCTCT